MKKKIITIGIIVLVIGVLTGICCRYIQWKREQREQAEELVLQLHYKHQNQPFGMSASTYYSGYHGYDEVRETELFVRLAAYNSRNMQENNGKEAVTLEDIEDYLSSEYNEDGSLRVDSIPENIQGYIDWFYEGGDKEIEEYWGELGRIAMEYQREHPEIELEDRGNMTTEQLQELINKYNDPDYEINAEIMGEQE